MRPGMRWPPCSGAQAQTNVCLCPGLGEQNLKEMGVRQHQFNGEQKDHANAKTLTASRARLLVYTCLPRGPPRSTRAHMASAPRQCSCGTRTQQPGLCNAAGCTQARGPQNMPPSNTYRASLKSCAHAVHPTGRPSRPQPARRLAWCAKGDALLPARRHKELKKTRIHTHNKKSMWRSTPAGWRRNEMGGRVRGDVIPGSLGIANTRIGTKGGQARSEQSSSCVQRRKDGGEGATRLPPPPRYQGPPCHQGPSTGRPFFPSSPRPASPCRAWHCGARAQPAPTTHPPPPHVRRPACESNASQPGG